MNDILEKIKQQIKEKNITLDNVLQNQTTPSKKKKRLALKIINLLGINTIEKLRFELNPQAAYKKTYIVLDTRNAKFLDNNTKMQWALSNSIVEFDNSTNIKNEILNIKEIRIRSFYVPKIYFSNALRASLYIEEFGNEAIIGQDGNKFHFFFLTNDPTAPDALDPSYFLPATQVGPPEIFDVKYLQYEMLAGYRFNEGRYKFDKPTNLTSTITISMRGPFNKITWPVYTSTVNIQILGAVEFNLIFPHIHGYPIGFRLISLFLPYFNTTEPVIDADKINYIRNIEIGRISVDSATVIRVIINSNNVGTGIHVAPPAMNPIIGTPLPTQVFITGYRHYIEMEISSYL